jgi:hypothetical protein
MVTLDRSVDLDDLPVRMTAGMPWCGLPPRPILAKANAGVRRSDTGTLQYLTIGHWRAPDFSTAVIVLAHDADPVAFHQAAITPDLRVREWPA